MVLFGHLNTQSSPSNLLKVRLPIQNSLLDNGLDVTCIFLRSSELEFDNALLRNCRSNLKHFRPILIKMVKQQRHWQNRSLANEVHKQWWQNPPTTSIKSVPKS